MCFYFYINVHLNRYRNHLLRDGLVIMEVCPKIASWMLLDNCLSKDVKTSEFQILDVEHTVFE